MKNAKLFRLKIRQDFLLPGGIYMDNSSIKTFQGISNFLTFLLKVSARYTPKQF